MVVYRLKDVDSVFNCADESWRVSLLLKFVGLLKGADPSDSPKPLIMLFQELPFRKLDWKPWVDLVLPTPEILFKGG